MGRDVPHQQLTLTTATKSIANNQQPSTGVVSHHQVVFSFSVIFFVVFTSPFLLSITVDTISLDDSCG